MFKTMLARRHCPKLAPKFATNKATAANNDYYYSPSRQPRVKLVANTPELELQKGDHLYVYKSFGTYTHHALYIGGGHVVQYSGFAKEMSSAPVEIVSLKEFSQGHKIYCKKHAKRFYTFSREEAIQRGLSRVGENDYSLMNNNCEHFVQWCLSGKHYSPQVQLTVFSLNTNLALYLIHHLVGEITSGFSLTEIIFQNLLLAMCLVLGLTLSMQLATHLLNRTLLSFRHADVAGVCARHLSRTAAMIAGLIVTLLVVIMINFFASQMGNPTQSLYYGLEYLGNYFSSDYKLGIVLCLCLPFIAILATGSACYYSLRNYFKFQKPKSLKTKTPSVVKRYALKTTIILAPFSMILIMYQTIAQIL
ncbi:MAG: lecithin retinol acyltransferase family protein [Legionellales bacterium]|nr:lecithin retinol acyltransferase family protein [Legionellales bacterium]